MLSTIFFHYALQSTEQELSDAFIRAATSIRVIFHSSTRYFLFPVAHFHSLSLFTQKL